MPSRPVFVVYSPHILLYCCIEKQQIDVKCILA